MSKPKLPKIIKISDAQVTLTCVGARNHAGQVVYTYPQLLEKGSLEVVSPKHVYHWMAGRDLYPTEEQMAALCAGRPVTFGSAQWA
jgi:hypothetical protein